MLLTLILTLTLSHYLTLSHSHTLSISHWITLDMLNNFCFHLYAQNSLSHSLSLNLSLSHSHSFSHSVTLSFTHFHVYAQKSLSHSLTHSFSLSHSFNLSFNHSWHAEQVLFSSLCSKVAVYRRKLQCFFFDSTITLTCDIRVHRAGSQLKIISSSQYGNLDILLF